MISTLFRRHFAIALLIGIWILSGCNQVKLSPEADDINDYIRQLSYNPAELLDLQTVDPNTNGRQLDREEIEKTQTKGLETACRTKTYSLNQNFKEVAILQPTSGIIWPGALVVGDGSMLNGLPTPMSIGRAPIRLTVDLPGMGKRGNFTVKDPSNGTVKSALDEALEWWNANAYEDGYYNEFRSSTLKATSYSSQQLAMDVGLNVKWAGNDVSAQFNQTTSTTEKVSMMVFKQVFYTVTVDDFDNPANLFGPEVTLDDVQDIMTPTTPPAYVRSVSYGRIIMFRMVTRITATDQEVAAALEYAKGGVQVDANLAIRYEEILENSTMNAITIGGNAEVTSEVVSAKTLGDLEPIITGKNAVYSRSNPGVPISYSIHYLKDNTLAKLGYTTSYTLESCDTYQFLHEKIRYTNKDRGEARVRLNYRLGNSSFIYRSSWREDIDANEHADINPPPGAYDVELEAQHNLPFPNLKGWEHVGFKQLNYVKSKKCYEVKWNNTYDELRIYTVSCN